MNHFCCDQHCLHCNLVVRGFSLGLAVLGCSCAGSGCYFDVDVGGCRCCCVLAAEDGSCCLRLGCCLAVVCSGVVRDLASEVLVYLGA